MALSKNDITKRGLETSLRNFGFWVLASREGCITYVPREYHTYHYESHSKSDSTSQKPRKKKRCKNNFTKFFEAWAHACEVSLVELTFVALHVIHKIKWITKNRPTASIIEIFRDLFNIIKIASFWQKKRTLTVQLWDYLWPVYNYHGVLQPFFMIN